MRLGWLQDHESGILGGAELFCRELLEACPSDVEVVPCSPKHIERADAYAVHNCFSYGVGVIAPLSRAPVVKSIYDVWPHGDPELRRWLLENAATLVFQSGPHQERFPWAYSSPAILVPPIAHLARFRAAAGKFHRDGTLWLGQMTGQHKGLQVAITWAARNGPVDFYGGGWLVPTGPGVRYLGQVPYEQVPALMASYERFLFLPAGQEACGRTILEAWSAGCEVITNENQGATWWIRSAPEALENGPALYWQAVKDSLRAVQSSG